MKLSLNDKKRVADFYHRRLKKHGTKSALTGDWDTKANQVKRFEILSKVGNLNNKKILDFGCGLGDLYTYLKPRFKNLDYHGIDIAAKIIEAAKKKHSKASFRTAEITDLIKEKKKYDYVFASGSLTFAIKPRKKYYFEVIKQMYDLAKIGIAFNLLDSEVYKPNKFYVTYDMQEVLKHCLTFTKKVKIITGYAEGDFTVYLYKK